MKTLRNLAFAFMALAAFACSKPETPENNNPQDDPKDDPAVEVTPVAMTFAATLEPSADVEAAATGVMSKVAFNGSSKSLWEAGDMICVYDGEEVRCFETEAAGETADFTGSAFEVDEYYAHYPYSDAVEFDGGAILTNLPASQTAVKGSFDPEAALAVAYAAKDADLAFKNVTSMLAFSVPAEVVLTSVALKGNADEKIAGDMSVTFGQDGLPVLADAGTPATTITLNGTMTDGSFYVLVRPGNYSGLTAVLTYEDGETLEISVDEPVTLNRSAYRYIGEVPEQEEEPVEPDQPGIDPNEPNIFVLGLAATVEELDPESKAAAMWALSTFPEASYLQIAKIPETDLSKCDVIWWHYHRDGSVNNPDQLAEFVPELYSDEAHAKISDYFNNGGHFLLSRYAVHYQAKLGAGLAADYYWGPNNCWGDPETGGFVSGGGDGFFCFDGLDKSHPLFNGLTSNDDNEWKISTSDAGYKLSNSTARYNRHEDWSDFYQKSAEEFKALTGATPLAKDGDQAIVIWEFEKATETRGHVICIGSPLYDWYSTDGHDGGEGYHSNILNLTKNAFSYLLSK